MDPQNLARQQPQWPDRLKAVCTTLQRRGRDAPHEPLRRELCLLLHSGLRRYLELHASRMGPVSPEDLDDLCSEKALDLFRRAESDKWRVDDRDGPQIAAYLSTVARNALVNHFQQRGRQSSWEASGMDDNPRREILPPANAEDAVSGREFAEAVVECADTLKERDRLIWILRIFHEMPSKRIAVHRDVDLKPSHVDVVLQRCRRAMAGCLSAKGYTPGDLPAGAFVALWTRFREETLPGSNPLR